MVATVRHDQALRMFRAYLEAEAGLSELTVAGYVSSSRLWFIWLGRKKKNWADVGIEEAGRYFTECKRRYAPTTCNFHLRSLRLLYRWGEQKRYVNHNPWMHIRRATGDPGKRPLFSLGDLARIKAYDPGDDWFARRDRAITLFLVSTGMRNGECVAVDVSAVDLDQGRVAVNQAKGGRTHWKAIVDEAAPALEEWINVLRPLRAQKNEPALWVGRFGKRIDRETVRAAVARTRQACGIEKEVTPHGIRKSAGTLMRQLGVPKEDIQQFYGHKRLYTTEIYIDEPEEAGLEVAHAHHPLFAAIK